jgi:hypothetical protein
VAELAQPTPQPVVAEVVAQTAAPEVPPVLKAPVTDAPVVLKQSAPEEIPASETRKTVEPAEEFSGPSAWSMLWRRLALSFGTVALVGIAAFVVRMQVPADRGDGSMAKLSPMVADKASESALVAEASDGKTIPAEPSAVPAPTATRLVAANEAPAPIMAPGSTADRELARRDTPLTEQRGMARDESIGRALGGAAIQTPAPASAPAAPLPTASKKAAVPEARSAQDLAKSERKAAPVKPATTAPAPAAQPLTIADGTFVQREVQSGLRRNLLSPPKPEVLTSFRIVPQGDAIQVIDADGSVYLGRSVATNSGTRFTASGTNVILGQLVTIEASSAPAPRANAGGEGDPAAKGKAANVDQRRGVLLRGRISISAGSSWEFEAQNR